MRLFGVTISRARPSGASGPSERGGWVPVIREPYDRRLAAQRGAAARDRRSPIRRLRLRHADRLRYRQAAAAAGRGDDDGIWTETTSPAFSPVLRKPNRSQTIVKFVESWMFSKLLHGNTYVLKERDERGVVTGALRARPAARDAARHARRRGLLPARARCA